MIADGIYEGVPADIYFKAMEWSGRISPSILEHAMLTMAHMKAAVDGLIEYESPALDFGQAFHCRLLEPERYKTAFAVAGQCEGETGKKARCSKSGSVRAEGRWYCHIHAPEHHAWREAVTPLSQSEADVITAMADEVFSHPVVKLVRAQGGTEVCIAWTCPRTGIKCKSRMDKWSPDTPEILDLKTCQSASPRSISNALEEYGYARAAEFRKDGIEVLTGTRPYYTLIFQEKKAYKIAVVNIGADTQPGACAEQRGLLAKWAECVKSGVYPGWGWQNGGPDFIEVDVPEWKLKSYDLLAGA